MLFPLCISLLFALHKSISSLLFTYAHQKGNSLLIMAGNQREYSPEPKLTRQAEMATLGLSHQLGSGEGSLTAITAHAWGLLAASDEVSSLDDSSSYIYSPPSRFGKSTPKPGSCPICHQPSFTMSLKMLQERNLKNSSRVHKQCVPLSITNTKSSNSLFFHTTLGKPLFKIGYN